MTDIVEFARQSWPFMLTGTVVFGILSFCPSALLRVLFALNRSKATQLDGQLHGFQGYCRFFYWIAAVQFAAGTLLLLVNAPF
ncbi:hypothetical protein PQU92_18260 [Asticcacaulis sp. BYS171W]|uniref:DUF4149 domain-containing protein n=1 Tax=Asticcacaulis aquaticus TaxID=2984212 RepID=A0ABT5HYT0_9CAUL|nr:hypothetical protein [Asticcacaulis aquaticus]MDC7685231.1 hypothetical protein [Asticcacaulis aquaticus]